MGDTLNNFRFIVGRLVNDPLVIPDLSSQFNPGDESPAAILRGVNAAFLLALGNGPLSHEALEYLSTHADGPGWSNAARFYLDALERLENEIQERMASDPEFSEAISDLARLLRNRSAIDDPESMGMIRRVFFPEGRGLPGNRLAGVRGLRRKRRINILALNENRVKSPHRQVLFTTNVLLTIPLKGDLEGAHLGREIREAVKPVLSERQAFWYDHPIPLGVDGGRNEAVYGLRGLDKAVRFEIERQTMPADSCVPVLLSVSTTHKGLQSIARSWLREELHKSGSIFNLDLFAITEEDAEKMVTEVLVPAAANYLKGADSDPLREVFGVDGEYGRHYSFLKAAAALWQVVVDRNIKATFKIDLDQVFPQEVLVSETGRSAFEHLSNPLWGADGTDMDGRHVRLGMLAGALVDATDIDKELFTTDVKWPQGEPRGERCFFDSALPQALSTEAEMMTRYSDTGADGRQACLQRVHVTGGTTGILIEDLRRYRPFTPSWIGRAEDQAYLMSVLFPDKGPVLRYVHAGGFFMRHDKEAFAADAMKAARVGKTVGDYVRIMVFSAYARALPWGADRTKAALDPFTGCFISKIPVTISTLRLALRTALLFGEGSVESAEEAEDLLSLGCSRLAKAAETVGNVNFVKQGYLRNKAGWNLYYDIIDAVEKGLQNQDPFAERISRKARSLIEGWRI